MATATKKSRAAERLARRPAHVRSPEMEFLIFEDNGGDYHWTIVADGATLARSAGFASYDDAEQAAQRVRNGVTSARFERRSTGGVPVDLIARPDSASDDDAERWLDD